ncbi:M23 family metallopeptidase [Deinococcus sp. Arct2-2]|uniref:M23 family metallopeptidase n=1 Tax=Deinococcus sp. Arct2-2 TaxID=2568653 RepID=UPI0010A39F2B|nr:M23 family metallopeptidase [Deinococcus sp. Arct2-2]THF69304.1 M23 family metallopeptidase [Deinococcus sp. Arct2-2]
MTSTTLLAALVIATLPWTAAALTLPLRGDDLNAGERYNAGVHTGGIQAEGKDIGALRRVSDTNWSRMKAGTTDTTVNSNWIVYGKPFYAMAAGTVVGCWRNAPDNIPGSLHPLYKPGLKFAGGGNHLWILQDDGSQALYAHAQPGSIPAALCPHNAQVFTGTNGKSDSTGIEQEVRVTAGARVNAGQFLGRIGNSGASSAPHLHVHLQKGGQPIPMTFGRGLTTPFTGGKASLNGPWTPLAGKTFPNASVLFWPPRPAGNLTFNGTEGADYQPLVDHLADSNMMPNLITCASNGSTYNSTWVPRQGQWASFHGMNTAQAAEKQASYTTQGYTRTSSYTCGSVTVAVWRK